VVVARVRRPWPHRRVGEAPEEIATLEEKQAASGATKAKASAARKTRWLIAARRF